MKIWKKNSTYQFFKSQQKQHAVINWDTIKKVWKEGGSKKSEKTSDVIYGRPSFSMHGIIAGEIEQYLSFFYTAVSGSLIVWIT